MNRKNLSRDGWVDTSFRRLPPERTARTSGPFFIEFKLKVITD